MKALRVRHLTIARDVKMKYGKDDEVRNKLIVASAFLAGMLYRSDMTCSMFTFAPDERMQVNAMANKLIESGKI